ncbi:stage II sporulation protein M [Acidobacteriota bacterium]
MNSENEVIPVPHVESTPWRLDLWLRKRILWVFLLALLLFILGALLSHIWLVNNPESAGEYFSLLSKIIRNKIPAGAEGPSLFLAVFINNLKASAFMVGLGLIPFLVLPAFGLLANGVGIGIVTSMVQLKGQNVLMMLLVGIVPHGIIEIPAFVLSGSLGIYMSIQFSKFILMGLRSETEPPLQLVKRILKTWLFVVVPLLSLAALIESYITPILLKGFLLR